MSIRHLAPLRKADLTLANGEVPEEMAAMMQQFAGDSTEMPKASTKTVTASTDAAGKPRFENVPPGTYRLAAEKAGFGDQRYTPKGAAAGARGSLRLSPGHIGGSLGVSCSYCHAEPYDSDTKKAKQTARSMIKMTWEINAANFGGRPQPKGTPSLWNKTPEQLAAYKKDRQAGAERPAAPSAEALPDADQVFANYRKAVGSIAVKSIHMSGTMASDLAPLRTVDGYAAFPDKYLLGLSFSGTEVKLVGDHGWALGPQGKTDVPSQRMGDIKDALEFFQPVKYAKSEAPRKVTGLEKIGDKTYSVVESNTPKRSERLYFDTQSGLLYKATWTGEPRSGWYRATCSLGIIALPWIPRSSNHRRPRNRDSQPWRSAAATQRCPGGRRTPLPTTNRRPSFCV
jgi:hypothetical protein